MSEPKDGKRGGSRHPEGAANVGNTKPISLHPLTPEEALRRAMATPPPPKGEREASGAAAKPKTKATKRP